VSTKGILKVNGVGDDPVDPMASPLRSVQVHGRKIRKNTTEQFRRDIEEDHEVVVTVKDLASSRSVAPSSRTRRVDTTHRGQAA
jgi:hypothetical protein